MHVDDPSFPIAYSMQLGVPSAVCITDETSQLYCVRPKTDGCPVHFDVGHTVYHDYVDGQMQEFGSYNHKPVTNLNQSFPLKFLVVRVFRAVHLLPYPLSGHPFHIGNLL